MRNDRKPLITSARVFAALLLILLTLFGLWLASHSILSVSVSGASGADTTIKVTSSDGQTKDFKTKSGKKTMFVSKDTYSVAVIAGTKSGLSTKATKGFLRKSSVSIALHSEAARRYAAYNPSPCMFELAGVFYSVSCSDYGTNIQKQLPATGTTPPTTAALSNITLYDTILATTPLDANSVAILTENMTDEGESFGVKAVDQNLQTTKSLHLPVGRDVSTLQISPISSTTSLVYNLDGQHVWQVSPLSDTVTPLDLTSKNTKGMFLVDVRGYNDSIIATYTNVPRTDSLESETLAGAKTAFVTTDTTNKLSFTVDGSFRQASACGAGYICAVDFKGLHIYTTDKDIYQVGFIPNVKEILSTKNGPRYLDDIGVFTYEPATNSGHYEYTFGEYESCGPQATYDGYLLCLITPKQEKVALAITQDSDATDLIDKQVLSLLEHEEVAGVNAVGNDIFIIPHYGEADMFVKSTAKLREVNKKITTIIKDTDIDTSKYRIRNAAE